MLRARPFRFRPIAVAACALALLGVPGASAQPADKGVPYWASITQSVARMRKGPSPTMPVTWEYRRKLLPVKVIQRHESWRRIEDPDGTTGWMAARLLSARRTGYVVGAVRAMRAAPDPAAPISWRAAPGVVGVLTDCADGWCYFDVSGRRGYIRSSEVWGGEDA